MSRQAQLNNSTALSLIACFDPIYLGVFRLCAANLLETLIKSVRASIDSKLTIVRPQFWILMAVSRDFKILITEDSNTSLVTAYTHS
jgi:hypothetical protein